MQYCSYCRHLVNVTEQCVNMVANTLFYMDGILVTGTQYSMLVLYWAFMVNITTDQNTVVC